MAIIKCKMCGGELVLEENSTVAECEYCGTKQTVPSADNEKKLTLFARANRLRFGCEFDKAAGVYETIVSEFPEEAEAYWGLILCKYGIEYVDDPATAKKVPTCHRSGFDSIMEDPNFELVLEYADVVARKIYREEAKQIEELRKDIIEVSSKEEPYDIFICYKETDELGSRTVDSVLAQDIYTELTEKGYRVFFSRITLEDKLGQEYEPYIFAALNSAKIMLVIGTDYEYFNAVWVKNEWSRYLKLMAADKSKHLIPCYKNIDAYDMPKEFARLQAQDLGKVGATQDLLRGIEKILPRKKAEAVIQQVTPAVSGAQAQVTRGNFALEDGSFEKAAEHFERALDQDPQCGDAYLGKVLAACKLSDPDGLTLRMLKKDMLRDFERAIQFSSPEKSAELKEKLAAICQEAVDDWKEKCDREKQSKYNIASGKQKMNTVKSLQEAAEAFRALAAENYLDSAQRYADCVAKAEEQQKAADRRRMERLARIRANNKEAKGLIAACGMGSVGLKTDGTVLATKNQSKEGSGTHLVSDWSEIVAIAAANEFTAGLRADGTVVVTEYLGEAAKYHGYKDALQWTDIVSIAASDILYGVKKDGTVVCTEYINPTEYDGRTKERMQVSGWRDIDRVFPGSDFAIGMKKDGTLIHTPTKKYPWLQEVTGWTDIVDIAVGGDFVVGLKKNGRLVMTGSRDLKYVEEARNWEGIVAIAAGYRHLVGITEEGKVIGVGDNMSGQINIHSWTDVVAVACGSTHTLCLKRKGTVGATPQIKTDFYGQHKVNNWKLFDDFAKLEEEKRTKPALIRAKKEEAREKLRREQNALKTELSNLKGFFVAKKRKELEDQIAALDERIRKI